MCILLTMPLHEPQEAAKELLFMEEDRRRVTQVCNLGAICCCCVRLSGNDLIDTCLRGQKCIELQRLMDSKCTELQRLVDSKTQALAELEAEVAKVCSACGDEMLHARQLW